MGERIEGTEGLDSPRIFEYLRDRILEYLRENLRRSLFGAVRHATEMLLREYSDGTFNFLLTKETFFLRMWIKSILRTGRFMF